MTVAAGMGSASRSTGRLQAARLKANTLTSKAGRAWGEVNGFNSIRLMVGSPPIVADLGMACVRLWFETSAVPKNKTKE